MSNFFKSPFISALLGGLVVAVVGLAAIELGWIGSEDSSTTVVQRPIAEPDSGKGSSKAPTVSDVYKDIGPGVVFIKAEISDGGDQGLFGLPSPNGGKQQATGSGFVINDKGHILTNAHVVDDAKEIEVGFGKDETVKGEIIGKDASSDVALIRVDIGKDKLKPLKLGNSSSLKVGDPVIAIGNPFGLDRTVTTGIVSALQRELAAPNGFTIDNVVQTDASINPGNSGGPLLDAFGRVVGINSQIASQSGGSEGIGFAVPVNTVKKELKQLEQRGSVDHAFLGITGLSLSADLLKDLNLPVSRGVLIQAVTDGGPAEKAGLKAGDTDVTVNGERVVLGGDIIIAVDDEQIKSMRQVVGIVDSKKPGDKLEITILRNKKKETKTVKLGTRPDSASPIE